VLEPNNGRDVSMGTLFLGRQVYGHVLECVYVCVCICVCVCVCVFAHAHVCACMRMVCDVMPQERGKTCVTWLCCNKVLDLARV
jgi:hypothetical protein